MYLYTEVKRCHNVSTEMTIKAKLSNGCRNVRPDPTKLQPKAWFTLVIRIGDFLLLTYVNNVSQTKVWGLILQKCQIHITFTQSHRPEDEIPDFYDKCEPGLTKTFLQSYVLDGLHEHQNDCNVI